MSMNNGWTGGQYSLFRWLFGAYLWAHFAHLLPWGTELFSHRGVLAQGSASPLLYLFPNVLAIWDAPVAVAVLLVLAAGLSVLLAVGVYDRLAALLLWYIWACCFGRNPLIANPSLPFVGWMLLAHACLPAAPYGSWAARHRVDPHGGWRFPQDIYRVAWVVMALGYTYSGYTKLLSPSWLDGTALTKVLENPLARPGFVRDALLALPDRCLHLATWGALGLELLFAPLALFACLRPWLWGALLVMHLGLIVVIDFADLSLGMVLWHVFTFNPAWIAPLKTAGVDTVFYDGHCGLCHRTVRWLLAEEHSGAQFCFAPLDSETFCTVFSADEQRTLPDSLVILTAAGSVLTRSTAVVYLLQRLGGLWRILGAVLAVVPTVLRDAAYDGMARTRHSFFATPAETCPLLPEVLRCRFRH